MTKKTIFKTSISLAAKVKAEKFRRLQNNPNKRKKVYLNTLATSVVNYYLNSLGWTTDLEGSDSWNPILQTMMDVADLRLPNYGKIECRVVLPHEDRVVIPAEVWFHRIAYVVVRLDESLTEAQILGFFRRVKQTEISLEQLESLTSLPGYLNQQKHSAAKVIHLSRWLEGITELDWLPPENFPSVNYRSISSQSMTQMEHLSSGVCRIKLVELGDPQRHNINLVVNVEPKETNEFSISVKVCPTSNGIYLPQGLELVVLDEGKKPIMCAQANDTETIEFCFSGELGEHFGVEASLDNYIKTETFII
ncbi:MAG: hypothetical protein Tsb0014_44680 [Pleurocapsa sp.]